MTTTPNANLDLAVIANLTPETNTPDVLRNVARWHGDAYRNRKRNATIAQALFTAAATAERKKDEWCGA